MKTPLSHAVPATDPCTRTSLQSFLFLLQNPCRPRHIKAVEITRTSLQSLVSVPFLAYCCDPFEDPGSAPHIQDVSPGIASGTREPERHPANVYSETDVRIDSACYSSLLQYWSSSDVHFDTSWTNNNAASLIGDYVA